MPVDSDKKYPSQPLRLDPNAEAADPFLPAFLARPEGTSVYHGFPVLNETETDGWYFGAITDFEGVDKCEYGDGFVVAPDGTRAGLVWEVGDGDIQVVAEPDKERWAVYAVWFPRVVRPVDDLVFDFRHVLPDLKKKYLEVNSQRQ